MSQSTKQPASAVFATHRQRADRDAHSPEAIRERRGPDFRLVPSALAMWLFVALTIATRSPWPMFFCMSLIAFLAFARARITNDQLITVWRTVIVASVSGSVGSMLAWVRILILDATPALSAVFAGRSSKIVGEFSVGGTPKQLAEGTVMVPVDLPQLGSVPLFLNPQRAHPSGDSGVEALQLQPGQAIEISATMQADDRPGLVPVVLRGEHGVELGEDAGPHGIWAFTAWLRRGLRWAVSELPDEVAGLIPGMVVGDSSRQSSEASGWFVSTGLSHLTAVSGSNVAVVIGAVLVMLTALMVPRMWRAVGCALALGLFVMAVGPEPSVLRATVMGSVGVVAVATVRWSDVMAALSFAVIVLMLLAPGMSVKYGFGLSVVATVGIVVMAPRLSRSFLRWWTHRCADWWGREPSVAEAMAVRLVCVAIAADVVTAPVIVLMTGTVSVTAIIANLLVAWCVPPITVVGLFIAPIGAILASWGAPAGLSWVLGGPLWPCGAWIVEVAETLAGVPRILTPGGWIWSFLWAGLMALIIASFYWLKQWRRLRWMWLAAACGLALTLHMEKPPPGQQAIAAMPTVVDVTGKQVHRITDDEQAVRMRGLDPTLDVFVNTSCGRPHNRPSVSKEGVTVIYPCRDGTKIVGSEG